MYGTAGLQGLAGPLIVSCAFTDTRSFLVCAPVAWARLPWGRTTLDLELPPLRRALCRVPILTSILLSPRIVAATSLYWMISREQCREPQCTTKSATFSTDSSIRSVYAQSTTFTSVPDCSIRRDPLPCREPDRSSINANPQYRRVWGVIRHGVSLQRQQRHQEGQQKQGEEGYIDGRMSFEQVGKAETPRESERGERRAETDRDIQALAYSTGTARASGRAARAMRFCSTGRRGNTVNGDNRWSGCAI